jgi:hypothetical protein
MKSKTFLLPLTALGLAAIGLFFAIAGHEEDVLKASHVEAGTQTPAGQSAPAIQHSVIPAPARTTAANWRENYGCDLACQGNSDAKTKNANAAVAYSEEEARWLDRQGFLSRSDIERFKKKTEQELAQLVRAGDPGATIFVAQILTNRGRFKEIAPALSRLAACDDLVSAHLMMGNGNIEDAKKTQMSMPGRSLLEQGQMANSAGSYKALAAVSFLRAYMKGDYVAGTKLWQMYPSGIPTSVMEMAGQVIAIDGEAYKHKHGTYPSYDPRPSRRH